MGPGEAERRRLVFTNLANGVPPDRIMEAQKISALEFERDITFVARKINSYRFERGMPMLACETQQQVMANKVALLHTLARLDLNKDPHFSHIETLPFTLETNGLMSVAEQRLFEMRLRAASGGKL